MAESRAANMSVGVVSPAGIGTLIDELRQRGHRVIGPQRRDGAIVNGEVTGLEDLPKGWTDVQAPGRYELQRRDDEALFGYAVGPDSWKRELFPPRQVLWSSVRDGHGLRFEPAEAVPTKAAFLGVRACELAAIAIQDRVFLHGLAIDTVYSANREDVVLVAVNCTDPSGSCFCVSMGTGPRVRTGNGTGGAPADGGGGADLVLTELVDDGPHEFVVEAATPLGQELLTAMDPRPVAPDHRIRADRRLDHAANSMGRTLDAEGVHDLLLGNLEHERWADVAQRCLACTNCTLVCPTCFCNQVEDVTSLDGAHATHERRWDSCFTLDFSHMRRGQRALVDRSRYRQWMTHKLATWVDQFGTSGCVGCGRCITWCPVGIDITAEVAAIAAHPDDRDLMTANTATIGTTPDVEGAAP